MEREGGPCTVPGNDRLRTEASLQQWVGSLAAGITDTAHHASGLIPIVRGSFHLSECITTRLFLGVGEEVTRREINRASPD